MKTSTLAVVFALAVSVGCEGDLPASAPTCDALETVATQAQALPAAEQLPCLEEVPLGWTVTTFEVERGVASFNLSHDIAGSDVVVVALMERCVSAEQAEPVELAPGEDQERIHVQSQTTYEAERFHAIEGGCIVTTLAFDGEGWGNALEQIEPVLTTTPRDVLAERLREASDGALDLDRMRR
ncbi:MAG: hypothetical protein KY469_06840 [Actinobacteria bacterium]|nr:hypothetical protein [Actinomycetota bacterium]